MEQFPVVENSQEKILDAKNLVLKNPWLSLDIVRKYLADEIDEENFKFRASFPPDLSEPARQFKKKHSREEIIYIFSVLDSDVDLQILCLNTNLKNGIRINESEYFNISVADSPGQFSEKDIQRMREIYAQNYVDNPKLQKVLLEKFDRFIEEEDFSTLTKQFYLFEKWGEILGFFITDYDTEKDEVRFKALNLAPEFSGKTLGSTLLKDQLDGIARFHKVTADTRANSCMASFYIERFSFIGTDVFDFEGESSMKIVRNDSQDVFASKTIPEKHLFNQAILNSRVEIEDGSVSIVLCEDSRSASFLEKYLKETESEKTFLTRCIKYIGSDEKVFSLLVFEKKNKEEAETFMKSFDYSGVKHEGSVIVV